MTTAEHPLTAPGPNGTGEHLAIPDPTPMPPSQPQSDQTIAAGFAEAAAADRDRAHRPREARVMATPPGNQLYTSGGPEHLQELERWIRFHQEEMVRGATVKADEYGSGDLEVMAGSMMVMVPGITFQQGMLLAIAFYAQGKVGRIISALQQQRMPSHDSWRDLEVYAEMGLKVLETGKWV